MEKLSGCIKCFLGAIMIVSILIVMLGCTKKTQPPLGEWDGNYLYGPHVRMKTDGTERENLISSFVDEDGTEYQLGDSYYARTTFFQQYMFINIYYYGEEDEYGYSTKQGRAIILYDMLQKTHFLIASTGLGYTKCSYFQLLYACDDFFVVKKIMHDNETSEYLTMTYDGTVLCEDDRFFDGAFVYGEHVFHCTSDGYLTYSTIDDRTPEIIFEYPPNATGEKNYVLSTPYENVFICNGCIFDPFTKKINKVESAPLMWYFFNKYFITYETRDLSDGVSGGALWIIKEDCSFQKELTFPNNMRLGPYGSAFYSDERYVTLFFLKEKSPPVGYKYNVETKKFYKNYIDSYCNDVGDPYSCLKGARCGKYYYAIRETRGLLWGGTYHFYRFNSETKETCVMNVPLYELYGSNSDGIPPTQKIAVRSY